MSDIFNKQPICDDSLVLKCVKFKFLAAKREFFEFAKYFVFCLKNYSNYDKHCIFFALEANLFDVVKNDSPLTLPQLIEKCKFNKRGGEAVINLLTALGILSIKIQVIFSSPYTIAF
jgi:hypothetical protein